MIRVAYNNQKSPPAPFVLVTLTSPLDETLLAGLPAQIDTAADRSLVPLSLLESMNLEPVDEVAIGGIGGNIETMPVFAVNLTIFDLPPHNARVVAHPAEPWMILGRDILNHYRIVLDGRNSVLEID